MNKRALKVLSRAAGVREVTGVGNTDDERVIIFHFAFQFSILLKGVYSDGDPPLPIPNREVKPVSADGTALRWESRSMPNLEKRGGGEPISFPFLFFLLSSGGGALSPTNFKL